MWRVVAGRHRFEAARKIGFVEVPCVLYYGLTDEEECLLDRWDNEMDEEHKLVNFLDEAEHCKFLQKTKGWSVRQIAQNKNVNRETIRLRLKFADIPEQVKRIVRGDNHGCHLTERHMREVLKLKKTRHMILILKEIITRGEVGCQEEGECTVVPMKHSEILNRVAEILAMESRGEVAPEVVTIAVEIASAKEEASPESCPSSSAESIARKRDSSGDEVPQVANEEEAWQKEEQTAHNIQAAKGSLGVESEQRSTEAMKFDVVPRWLKWSSFPVRLGNLWDLFETLLKYEMRYKYSHSQNGKDDGFFYLETEENTPEGTFKHLGRLLRQQPKTVEKKLRILEKLGLVAIQKSALPKYPRFRICWEHLKMVYDLEAWEIPFDEGGLKHLPAAFSGPLEPTPMHTIWVRDGEVKEGLDPLGEKVRKGLKTLGASTRLLAKLHKEYPLGLLWRLLEELPSRTASYEQEHSQQVSKPLDFFLGCLRKEATRNT